MTSNGNGLKEIQLPVLYNFARAISAVFDIQTLMTHFFNILKTAVDFDSGAYFVRHENHAEGRVYVKGGMDKEKVDAFSSAFLTRVRGVCRDLPEERLPSIGVSVLMERNNGAGQTGPMRFKDLPLKYQGVCAGLITLVSYGEKDPFDDSEVINVMAAHANAVLDRLLTHMFAEEKKLAEILLNMSEGVFIIDRNGHFTAVNPKGLELAAGLCDREVSCVEGSSGERGVFSGCDCEFARCLKTVKESAAPLKEVRQEEIKNGQGRIFTISISALDPEGGYIITAKDVTEERLMQKRLMLSSKLASLGEMAAGVAHEINNPLQAILCNIELLEYDANDPGHKRLKRVRDGVLRIKTIIKDLLIFAREQTTETENADLNIVIEKSLDILKHQLRMVNVGIRLELSPHPVIVKINRNMFQQVIINLLQNARDAIEDSGVGSTVTIRSELVAGKEAVVEVTDDGPGIPEEIQYRVFDPFFTTKDVGKGTGLGLSVSRKIVEGMEGSIVVASSPGKKTTFRISIPHHGVVIDERRGKKRREYDYSVLRDRSILMVDDEDGVLQIVTEALTPKVGSVEPVQNSKDAFERIKERDYDFIFLDIKMPGMDGMDLFRKLAEAKPGLTERVIFMTGDIESKKTADFLRLTGCRYLAKPFSINELLDVMCERTLRADAVKG